MSRLTIAAGLCFLLCVTGLAQEGQERERDDPDRFLLISQKIFNNKKALLTSM